MPSLAVRPGRSLHILILGFALIAAAPPAQAGLWPFGKKGVDYKIEIEGAGSDARERRLRERGVTDGESEHPPASSAEAESLGAALAERYRKLMVADGFYDARVDYHFEDGKPLRLIYKIDAGEQYHFSGWRIDWKGRPLTLANRGPDFAIKEGGPATIDSIVAGGGEIEKELLEKHCLLSLTIAPKAEIDPAAHAVEAIFLITPGAEANFGPTEIKGNGRVTDDTVKKFVTWKEGQCFHRKEVEATKANLIKSQLFARADAVVPDAPNADGEAPLTVDLKERRRHTISAGASYETDTGYGVTGHWEDRNVRGHAEKLSVDAAISELEYNLAPTYSIPYFLRDDQKLNIGAAAAREETDAYDSTNLTASTTLERKLRDHLTGGLGIGARATDVTQAGETDTYGLLFIPAYLEWDNRSDTLDPKGGILARLSAAPYTDITGKGVSFVKTTATGQTYFSSKDLPFEPTIAVRGAIGNISGAGTDGVPPDLRFYAGGGGSVRGYAYQALGPRIRSSDPDDDDDPLGGTSWTEVSTELRLRYNETIGSAFFLDGGNVYDQSVPNVAKNLFWGAGAGIRYFSPIGPLRVDVAVPLDKREGDAAWQLYVSVGQAF